MGSESCIRDSKNTEIAVNEGFAALANIDVLDEAMADDCQGLEFAFDRVKLPAGGGTAFEIPSAESDESEMAKDITGVIVKDGKTHLPNRQLKRLAELKQERARATNPKLRASLVHQLAGRIGQRHQVENPKVGGAPKG